ncbi:serine protease [Jannaschia pagri]|uniref:Probable periplasmic serine endoprotease DegP-like n=2 Tax=Roseobacteraceae TaxID=2854170 RepID=A0ABQ4NJY5_9RHOB|nr:serine protease [Jannaschia sp. AI_61]GIT94719.1 serine protease [Jannaschia sp. AI_62]
MYTSLQSNRPVAALRALTAFALGLVMLVVSSLAAAAQGRPDSFADLVDQVSGSVVNITTNTSVAVSDRGPNRGNPLEDFFEEFRDRNNPGQRERPRRRGSALGSGFVISEDGYIVTNNHVIENADEILIEFFSGNELPAEIVGTDPDTDIALLKVESDSPLEFVPFGNSSAMRTGDWVMAMGNPLGQGFSVSAGIVSSTGRNLQGVYDDFIQTDAAINRGNSGGPLFNLDGEVIGVNTAILSPNGGSIGIGFAMASNVVTNVVDQLQEFGETRRGWLGVRIQDVDPELAEALGLANANGALVTDVPDGPAKDAGILPRDVILTFDGVAIEDTGQLIRVVGNAPVNKAVRVIVFRDGGEETVLVTLGRREEANTPRPASAQVPQGPAQSDLMGMTVSNLTDELRAQLGLDGDASGVVVSDIDADSSAYDKGLRAGDLIEEAGQVRVRTVAELEDRLDEARDAGQKSFLLLIRRGGDPRFVALSLDEE